MLTALNKTAVKVSIPESAFRNLNTEKSVANYVSEQVSTVDLMQGIQQELATLLNHKQARALQSTHSPYPKKYPAGYGLPDLSYFNPHSVADRATVRNLLEGAISRFEKRLRNIHISPGNAAHNRILSSMHFRISAELEADPATIVVFDALIYPIVDHVVIDHVRH